MFDQITTTMAGKLLDYSILGMLVIALGYLYYRATNKIEALYAKLLDQTEVLTKVTRDSTTVMEAVVAAQNKNADASRELTETIRLWAARRGD